MALLAWAALVLNAIAAVATIALMDADYQMAAVAYSPETVDLAVENQSVNLNRIKGGTRFNYRSNSHKC